MINNYFNENGVYTHSKLANKDSEPPINATRKELPKYNDGEWPKLIDGEWVIMLDYYGVNIYREDGTFYVCNERCYELDATETIAKPPSKYHTMHKNGIWLVDIEYKKNDMLSIVHMEKSIAKKNGFLFEGVLYDSNNSAQAAYSDFRYCLSVDPDYSTENWKASSGVWVTMNKHRFTLLMEAWRVHYEKCFEWQKNKEIEINNCSTVEELEQLELKFPTDIL